jgi:acetolactate synthase-1/3 small subunit
MTVVVEIDEIGARLVEANLYKLINVLWVEDVTHLPAVTRDLALIKVGAIGEERAQVLQMIEVFRARVVDMAGESLIAEITGTPEKIDGFVQVLEPFGILSVARTGTVAMRRGTESAGAEWDTLTTPLAQERDLEPYDGDRPATPVFVGVPISESYPGTSKRSI